MRARAALSERAAVLPLRDTCAGAGRYRWQEIAPSVARVASVCSRVALHRDARHRLWLNLEQIQILLHN